MCVLSGYCRYSVVNYDYAAIRSTSLQASQTVIACYVKVVRTGGIFIDWGDLVILLLLWRC